MRERVTEHKRGGLRELPATAICGNDITSSCLYVSALAIIYAGKWAWVSLLVVAGVLFLYRRIYAEVVGALPLNGGAYNALLNTTSKSLASMAACLTILSYTATAVISANEAMHYGHGIWPALPVIPATVALLAAFMLLTIVGITESSKVAVGIFLFHLATLAVLLLAGGVYLLTNGLTVLSSNFALPSEQGLMAALFFGFAASMLGISGFESSANFVEEQAEGVFPRTLRNMWVAVSVLNPTLALLALALVPIPDVASHEEALLAHMGGIAAGEWLAWLISVDAILVLSGAVLTSYVGVTGLVRRMTLDRCLPQFLLKSSPRRTYHRIIVLFFCVCVSILLITEGRLEALAGVYTLSFLSVMALFGVGNILLKVKRGGLPRPERAAWPAVILAIALTMLGLAGNVLMNPDYVWVLVEYLVPTLLVVAIMLGRIGLLKACLFVVQAVSEKIRGITGGLSESLQERIRAINSQQFVFFSRGDNLHNLNRVVLYVLKNEHTSRIKVVTVVGDGDDPAPRLERDIGFLDEAYPEVDIELVVIRGRFGPDLVKRLSKEWQVPANFMFIGSPGDHFVYGLAELGGVRLII
ncbi:MAG: APC family permease [Acidobacteria bacterium]|nr:APC family permease [Acidobacteriota bacterium]